RVVSHPQALGQCRDYISTHGFEAVEMSNTAVAAESVAKGTDIHTAAIASSETAELYGLSILDHDIQTSYQNATRFAVFSRVRNAAAQGSEDSRFILMFTVKNEAGSLARAIDVIGEYGFNMSALRSRPMGSLAWRYYFYVEASGDIFSEKGQEMLEKLRGVCDRLKVVGNFPEPGEL
ncbi:MAG: bifunctional chorismate mutase/prephenate dehydratase, partial [Lachnospiraceae bacterium]|nr:bifunctional chorismate mutase/prephenate dehydratase [Lachnospiraceae bacterium]